MTFSGLTGQNATHEPWRWHARSARCIRGSQPLGKRCVKLAPPGKYSSATGDGRKLRVLDVVPVEEKDSLFVGLLEVEAA
jgi:hypothetical protein